MAGGKTQGPVCGYPFNYNWDVPKPAEEKADTQAGSGVSNIRLVPTGAAMEPPSEPSRAAAPRSEPGAQPLREAAPEGFEEFYVSVDEEYDGYIRIRVGTDFANERQRDFIEKALRAALAATSSGASETK